MFTDNEINAIKAEVSFCKSELIDKVKNILKEQYLTHDEKENMEKLLEKVTTGNYDYIEPDFSGKEVLGYYINIAEGTAKKAIGSGFCFGYDNETHNVVIDSMAWIDTE